MKRTIAILVGVVSVGTFGVPGHPLWAQPAAAPPRRPPRLTCLAPQDRRHQPSEGHQELPQVQEHADGNEEGGRGLRRSDRRLQGRGQAASDPGRAGHHPGAAQKIAKDIKDLNYRAQSKSEEFNAALQKHQFEQMVVTYKDIEKAVEAFAKARSLELVMHYQDGEGPEMFIPQFFSRRMSTGACQPIYMAGGPAGGMDITLSITEMLNKGMNPGSEAAPPAHGAPSIADIVNTCKAPAGRWIGRPATS